MELSQLAPVQTKQGYETKALREQLDLKKTNKKLAEVWEAHCIVSSQSKEASANTMAGPSPKGLYE